MTETAIEAATNGLDPPGIERMEIEASAGFVDTAEVQELGRRALTYLEVGYPVHLCGPAGTGKTTLAFHIAQQLDRPVTVLHGDDEFRSSDLVGRNSGYRRQRVVDNYIRAVVKTQDEISQSWHDNVLTTACRFGYTLIYDEFTRSRPEANNALLSVLEERLLNLPKLEHRGDSYVEVHPSFRAIFTSNPEEYAGVHKTQDALMDRLITIRLGHLNRATEVAITAARSGIDQREAETVVDIVRELRTRSENRNRPTIRACIAIARVLAHRESSVDPRDDFFRRVCQDVLNMENASRGATLFPEETVDEVVGQVHAARRTRRKAPPRRRRPKKQKES